MGLFSLFSNKPVDEFARQLAQDLSKRFPPSFEKAEEKKVSQNRITRVLEETFVKASKFCGDNRLGVYRKARLGNTFKWELRELGYSDRFVELATEGLVVYMTRGGREKAASKN